MLLAARLSAVTKKPRLRWIRRRSSSVRPFGSFHSAMSRLMLISCGIQWLAQEARYFSQAHLYLNGTSWLTSVLPLMMRLSSSRMRRKLCRHLHHRHRDGAARSDRCSGRRCTATKLGRRVEAGIQTVLQAESSYAVSSLRIAAFVVPKRLVFVSKLYAAQIVRVYWHASQRRIVDRAELRRRAVCRVALAVAEPAVSEARRQSAVSR